MGENEYVIFLDVLGKLGLLVIVATMVERLLAFVFEYEWFIRLTTKTEKGKVVSKFPGLKGLVALAVSLGISYTYKFDILQVVFRLAAPDPIGMTFTAFVIAGGSAGAIAIFQAYLKFGKTSRDAIMAAGRAEADAKIAVAELGREEAAVRLRSAEQAAAEIVVVNIEVVSDAKYEISVDYEKVAFESGEGSVRVQADRRHTLAWVFAGTPGTSYAISLETPDGRLVISENPIEETIGRGGLATGNVPFYVEK